MKTYLKIIWPIALSMVFFASCSNEANFGGEASTVSSADDATVSKVENVGAQTCDGDTVKLSWSNPEIQKCMDSGKIWHFPNKYDSKSYCSDVQAASSYSCDKEGYIDYSESKGISTTVLVDKLTEGSKLVSCGESSEASAFPWAMAQFVTSTGDDECNVSSTPITACFVSGSTGCAAGDYDCIVQWCFDNAK